MGDFLLRPYRSPGKRKATRLRHGVKKKNHKDSITFSPWCLTKKQKSLSFPHWANVCFKIALFVVWEKGHSDAFQPNSLELALKWKGAPSPHLSPVSPPKPCSCMFFHRSGAFPTDFDVVWDGSGGQPRDLSAFCFC